MENAPESKDSSQCVRVAVNIRPLVTAELLVGCTDCISVVPGEPQIQIGSHSYTFDHVFGSTGQASSQIYDECVAPLVDALLHGYNGTVLAYGQTGSGKTYTMGTNYNGEGHNGGIIPKVMETIFSRVEESKDSTEILIRVSFIEIFKEEVFDLLDPNPPISSRGDGSLAKPAGIARAPIQIRENCNGGITLGGVTEAEVKTKEEMASYLLRGSFARATASTNMNSQSSRSHAIFTISMEQKKVASCPNGGAQDGDDILSAKLHLVDLAGSERAKRTGADGTRLREGIHINKGLLALGNVISALGDDRKRKEGGHVPYRDSKLTRLLQDSLGGNSKTVMIACVSPAETNAEETLNTLKYANRARNIQNKAVINRDPVAAQMQRMRNQIEQLQAEVLFLRGDPAASSEEVQNLKHKISLLETSNAELHKKLQERQSDCEHARQLALDSQVEKDELIMKIESARAGKSWDEIDSTSDQDSNLVKTYVAKIQELEEKLLRFQNLNKAKEHVSAFVKRLELHDDGLHSKDSYSADFCELSSDTKDDINAVDEADDKIKEQEHSSLQEILDMELKELDKKLEQKEAEMKQFANVDTSVMKQHYDKKVQELENEKRALQNEIEMLKQNIAHVSSNTDESAQKLKGDYLQKLNLLEAQVTQLKKKQDAQAQLLRHKQRSDEAAKRLQDEIQRIKTHKVQLQQKIKQESEQFRLWKASREKEVLQLKKEGRRNEFEMHKLLALNQRQKMVLQRKTEEAAMATKRLKELLESRKATSREAIGGNGPGIQALMQAIEHELEVTVRVHEVRSEYERQMEERARMAKEVAELKEEAQTSQINSSNFSQSMSPGARNSRIFALENMLASTSSTLVAMGSQLSEAEERERAFSGRGRWHQVRSLAEAKNIMNYLFNLVSSSRCLLWDKEIVCREKDSGIRDLKDKVVSLVRQLEIQKMTIIRQEKLQKLSLKKQSKENTFTSLESAPNGKSHVYDLRAKGSRNSVVFSNMGNSIEYIMDISDSEHSDLDATDGDKVHSDMETKDDDPEWVASVKHLAKKKTSRKSHAVAVQPIYISDSESTKTESSGEGLGISNTKASSGVCCSCSKQSLCKRKCECRAAGGSCGASCNCAPTKCTNRQSAPTKDSEALVVSELGEGSVRTGDQDLASQGAMLLQSALADKKVDPNDEVLARRKPLSDIGNSTAKPNVPKPSMRKKWKNPVIQLVPSVPPTSQPEIIEVSAKSDTTSEVQPEIPLQLPRAMRSASSNTNPLREKNSQEPPHVSNAVKGNDNETLKTAPQVQRMTDEKENHL